MTINYIYVHLDGISNSVFSKGLNLLDFNQAIVQRPQNLLLLESKSLEGEYEPHTGLKILRGEAVNQFFNKKNRLAGSEIKWIDFKDINFLQQLSQMEIAELLYFAHMTTQLHSPFFYKLQNNYVYFEKTEEMSKVYYRYMDDFYHVLGTKISQRVQEKTQQRKFFFKKEKNIPVVPLPLLKELKPIFQEGIALSFSQEGLINDAYKIPLYIVEDRIREIEKEIARDKKRVLTLVYHPIEEKWSIEPEEWQESEGWKQV